MEDAGVENERSRSKDRLTDRESGKGWIKKIKGGVKSENGGETKHGGREKKNWEKK